jgi:hypothetical protein
LTEATSTKNITSFIVDVRVPRMQELCPTIMGGGGGGGLIFFDHGCRGQSSSKALLHTKYLSGCHFVVKLSTKPHP